MFPTFISILDIQSWWEVPSVAHFCSLFRTAFNLLDFDIEDLEEALLTDGTEESSWLQELIVRLLSGCLPNNEISTFNYQMFLRRLFRQKCQEHDQYNPFNTDIDFQLLPLRTKVDILHALCDFRLDADDVLDRLKNLEADSLRVEPLGYDDNQSAYWYFYGTRLYREDFKNKNSKKEKSIWQVICFTEEDWFQLAKKFKKSVSKAEKQLYNTLTENFLPELPRLFREKERLARKRLLENQPRRTSSRIRKQELVAEQEETTKQQLEAERLEKERLEQEKREQHKDSVEKRRREAYERRARLKEQSDTQSDNSENRYDMAGAKTRVKKSKSRQRHNSESSASSKDRSSVFSNASNRSSNRSNARAENKAATNTTTVGRQTNNSLACATGQIVIQPVSNPHRKKLKTSQVFRQTAEDLQTGMHKILDHVKNHNDAWPFVDPVDEEYAPNYYSVIRKPMDLQSMEERLERGHYKTFSKFKDDFQLIVDNCRLYNGADNEYTKMVDNLQKVFERITDRYLDEITSTDEEIAVEYPDQNKDPKMNNKRKKSDSSIVMKRKPTLAAETDKKRERSHSTTDSLGREDSEHAEPEVVEPPPPPPPVTNTTATGKKHSKKETNQNSKSSSKKHQKNKSKSNKSDSAKKKNNQKAVKAKKLPPAKAKSPSPVRSRSKSFSRSPSRDRWSSSPPPSWPPSSPDSRFDFSPHRNKKKGNFSDGEKSNSTFSKNDKWKEVYKGDFDVKFLKDKSPSPPKHKDKHNKLRETIEKLKAKSEFANKLKEKEPREDKMKENKDDNKNKHHPEKNKHRNSKPKNTQQKTVVKTAVDVEDACSTADSNQSESNRQKNSAKNASMEALTLATEQTLKDINKWLDDTPKFSEFSSASNSPSHFSSLDDFDLKMEQDIRKRNEKLFPKKDTAPKEKKKAFNRDPTKFIRRREVQRTIDRLQPGKSKGNLITNIQNTNKPDELFPLGPLSKAKDTKNSLIVKTDDSAPKLSLGSVLDSFGAHKFVDDAKKEEEQQPKKDEVKLVEVDAKATESLFEVTNNSKNKVEELLKVEDPVKREKEPVKIGSSPGKATPNLSAWFKAFGAPKVQPVQKKSDGKADAKDDKVVEEKKDEVKKVPPGDPSPSPDSPLLLSHGQPISRQRKISTGSSMSERSSFSQDMDSPRVGIDERLSYPAPYPSPLHKSPSGASPVMASPRPDVSPKSTPYPAFNGQMRVGFYQDTVSTKSSPDKSCSPRDNPQSPYAQYSEHVYTPPTQNSTAYSYGNPPYYSQSPCYSTQTNMDTNYSYGNNNKQPQQQYPVKIVPNYANSPVSNAQMHSPQQPNSPATQQQQMSPNLEAGTVVRNVPTEKQMFPVKKRAYNENESPDLALVIQNRQQDMVDTNSQHSLSPASVDSPKAYVQNLPEQRQTPQGNVVDSNQDDKFLPNPNYNFNSDVYPLNIPTARPLDGDRTLDMSKYTNMGYAGAEMPFPRGRTDLNFARSTPTTAPIQTITPQTSTNGNNQNIPSPNLVMRYSDPNMMTTYKQMNPNSGTPLNRNILQTVRSATNETLTNRLTQPLDVSGGYKSTNYNATSLDIDQSLNLRGNIGNISHIVDRFPADERMLGLQSGGQAFYPEKTLATAHMLSKPIATSSSGLPMFTQPNITIPAYRENMQANSPLYGRQMELQTSNVLPQQEKAVSLPSQVAEKKSKKRKSAKTATPSTGQTENPSNTASSAPNQGFQSYAGLKNSTAALEPSAISLKTTSVVPGSAFNFGPGPAGLGLGAGLYGDKDAYPNFLEDYRSAPNYYMAAAAAAHHRSTPEASEKPVRTAHQPATNQAPPTYPFLGAPQPRPPSYPLGGAFMPPPPHQASLMDPSSPLYQQYLQAGVLHQGLLGPGAYPAGYHHPALSMRQPYDSMTRPSWL